MSSAETENWTRSEADAHAVAGGCWFDLAAAERVRTFFKKFLRQSKGEWAGKPFELIEWQWKDLIAPLFGWKRADGTRRYRKGYVEIPKKNGKSTLSSGIALYLLVGDSEPGAEVYSAAADRDQATIVFGESANMVEKSPDLSRRLEVVRSTKRIIFPAQNAFYKALSAEVATKEGLNIHGLIFDELHAQPDRRLWDTLTYGGASRRQPMLLSITTAGHDKQSICWEQHEYADRVLTGVFYDDSFFAYIAAADEKADWTAEETWKKANPSYGITIADSDFRTACDEAKNSPAKENTFKRYRLNIWTEQETRWIGLEAWDRCAETFEPPVSGRCFAGLDLAATGDLCSLVLVFPREDGADVLPFFWIPASRAELKERRDRVPYRQWAKGDFITLTDGDSTDYRFIRAKINELCQTYDVQQILFDPWNARHLATELKDEDGLQVVEFPQTIRHFTEPTKWLETAIRDRKIRHGGHPVLRWNASCATVKTDPSGNIRPVKPDHTGGNRIDGIVATIMAVGGMLVNPNEGTSVYDSRDMAFV